MEYLLLFVVVVASIIVFFSAELGASGKKILKNRTFQLIAPLVLMSIFVIAYENNFLLFLVEWRIILFYIAYFILKCLPWLWVAQIIGLLLIASLPILIAMLIEKWKKFDFSLVKIAYRVSGVLWLISAILYTVGIPGFNNL